MHGAFVLACLQLVSATVDRVGALEAEIAAMRREFSERVGAMEVELAALRNGAGHASHMLSLPAEVSERVGADGSSVRATPGGSRRLSSASPSTYLSVRKASHVVHEFPSGHTCPNVQGFTQLLPIAADGTVSWDPSPLVPSANLSLGSVASDWSVSEVQRMPAPFKVVHDADCSGTPSLEVQMATTVHSLEVSGSLTVAGAAVGGGAEWMSFTDGANAIAASDVTYHGEYAFYKKENGMVCFSGGVKKLSGSWASGDVIANLPVGYRPDWWVFMVSNCDEVQTCTIKVGSSGYLTYSGAGNQVIYFNGVCFHAVR